MRCVKLIIIDEGIRNISAEIDPHILKEELMNKQKYIITSEGVFIDLGDRTYEDMIIRAYRKSKNG